LLDPACASQASGAYAGSCVNRYCMAPAAAAPASSPAPDDESRIGITDWLYRSLRRAGRAEGQTAKACALMRRLVEDEAHWNAFGFIGGPGGRPDLAGGIVGAG